jgi:hypothetical protein
MFIPKVPLWIYTMVFKCSYIQNKTILFKVEKIAMWYSVLGEVDLNDEYDIECTLA